MIHPGASCTIQSASNAHREVQYSVSQAGHLSSLPHRNIV